MFTTEMIIAMLKAYMRNTRIISQLEFELESIARLVTDEDIISSLMLYSSDSEAVNAGRISDRTSGAAMRYQEDVLTMRSEMEVSLKRELAILRADKARLDHYVGLLEDRQKEVILGLYIDGSAVGDLAGKFDFTPKTIRARKDRAVMELCAMFNRLTDICK